MGRRRKKPPISTRTAVILAGSAVAVVFLIGLAIVVRSSRPLARYLPPPPPQNADEAWRSLLGTWSHTVKSPNSKAVSTYRFTADRKFIRSSSVSGGALPMPVTSKTVMPVLGVKVFDDEIHLTLGPGTNELGNATPAQAIAFRFTGPRTIVLVIGDDEDEIEYIREK